MAADNPAGDIFYSNLSFSEKQGKLLQLYRDSRSKYTRRACADYLRSLQLQLEAVQAEGENVLDSPLAEDVPEPQS